MSPSLFSICRSIDLVCVLLEEGDSDINETMGWKIYEFCLTTFFSILKDANHDQVIGWFGSNLFVARDHNFVSVVHVVSLDYF